MNTNRIGRTGTVNKKFDLKSFASNGGYNYYKIIWENSNLINIPSSAGLGREILGFNSIRHTNDVPNGGLYVFPVKAAITVNAYAGDGVVRANAKESFSSNFEAQTTYNRTANSGEQKTATNNDTACGASGSRKTLSASTSPDLFTFTCESAVITYDINLNWDKDDPTGGICSGSLYAEYDVLIKPEFIDYIDPPDTDVTREQII